MRNREQTIIEIQWQGHTYDDRFKRRGMQSTENMYKREREEELERKEDFEDFFESYHLRTFPDVELSPNPSLCICMSHSSSEILRIKITLEFLLLFFPLNTLRVILIC